MISLVTETTGSAGEGTPQKSFRFEQRGKRAANSQPYSEGKLPLERGFARLRAVGHGMQVKEFSVSLKTPVGTRPL